MKDELRSLTVVAAVIRNRLGEVLLTRRPEGRHMGGLWEFPGGKLDNEKMQTLMIIHCMTDPRLTEADYDRLRQKNAFALDLVAAEIMELSGISSDALRRARASFLSGAEGPGVVSAGRGAGVPVFAGADPENDGRGIDPAADDGGMGGVGSVPGSGE